MKPDKKQLLQSVAEFLMNDVRPAINDPRLSFRVLIASNLARIAATELSADDPYDVEQRLRWKDLAARVREGKLDEAQLVEARKQMMIELRERLQIDNPGFDLRAEID
jgi:hypothetical protein